MSAAEEVRAAAASRILLFDGAFGTAIQAYRLDEAAYRGGFDLGRDQKGNNDLLVLTRPDIIAEITRGYLDAGADIVSTNTFNSNRVSQADYAAGDLTRELNLAAAAIARAEAKRAEDRDGRRRFVAGVIGPTSKTLSLSPDVSDPGFREIEFDAMKAVYREQADALLEGGVDFILIETIFDTLNAKSGVLAVIEAGDARGEPVPLMLSMTVTDMSGRNLSGHSVEAFWHAVRHARPLTIGLNCSFGARELRPHLQSLARIADTLILAYPNAGLPNELGHYDEPPEVTAALIRDWAENGLINVVGGCCGTTAAHIAALRQAVDGLTPRQIPRPAPALRLSGLDPFTLAAA